MTITEDEHAIVNLFAEDHSGDDSSGAAFTTLVMTAERVFAFPERAVLLWSGCTRQAAEYTYPAGLVAKWRQRRGGSLDKRMHNGSTE